MSRPSAPAGQKRESQWTARGVVLLALVSFMVGIAVGSLTRSASPPVATTAASGKVGAGVPPNGGLKQALSAEALQPLTAPMLAAIKADPKNPEPLIQLGNLYYDHKLFKESLDYYQRALELDPKNVDVRTDLGTAYWYLGSADKAMTEYEKALAIRPNYGPTLMNFGVVRMEGLKNYQGAIALWRKLLETNPNFPQKQQILQLLAQAEQRQKQ